jgi:hypothetical protein
MMLRDRAAALSAFICVLLALMLAPGSAIAHRFHVGITAIGANAASGNIEIVHTYMAHDVEALLAKLHGRRIDLGLEPDQLLFRRYVEQRFFITAPGGERLLLRWVGASVDADSIVLFQETDHRALAPAALIHNRVLTDFLPDQQNTVNLDLGGQRHSLIFERSRSVQTIP